jgi:hypothetical protein
VSTPLNHLPHHGQRAHLKVAAAPIALDGPIHVADDKLPAALLETTQKLSSQVTLGHRFLRVRAAAGVDLRADAF